MEVKEAGKIRKTADRWLIMAFLCMAVSAQVAGQRTPIARNLDIGVEDNKAIIHYDLNTRQPDSRHSVELQFLDQDYRLLSPQLVTGDIGHDIAPGTDRQISWEITNDMELLGSEITPVIFVDGKSKQFSNTGGPRNAYLSLLMPGLGDYFVADPSLMTFKPYMRTLSSLGLIAAGIWMGKQRYLGEGSYIKAVNVLRIPNTNGWGYQYVEDIYDKYIPGDMQYVLFKGDSEVFISLGAAIWAADIIWVLAKGSNNRKFMDAATKGSSFQLGYVPGGAALSYSFTF